VYVSSLAGFAENNQVLGIYKTVVGLVSARARFVDDLTYFRDHGPISLAREIILS